METKINRSGTQIEAELITTIDRSNEELYGLEVGVNYVEIFRVLKTLVYKYKEIEGMCYVHILNSSFTQPEDDDIFKIGEALKLAHEEISRLMHTKKGKHEEYFIAIDGVDFYTEVNKKTGSIQDLAGKEPA